MNNLTPRMDALQASGMIQRSGYYKPADFKARCGVNPRYFPKYFRLSATGLVIIRAAFITDCNTHFAAVRDNWRTIGI